MTSPYETVEEIAKSVDKTLLATDPRLRGAVSIAHEDGSFFLFRDAFACKHTVEHKTLGPQSFVIVFTEHYGFHIYDQSEVAITCFKIIYDELGDLLPAK